MVMRWPSAGCDGRLTHRLGNEWRPCHFGLGMVIKAGVLIALLNDAVRK